MNNLELGDRFSESLSKQDMQQLQNLFPDGRTRFTLNQVKNLILDEMEKLGIEPTE